MTGNTLLVQHGIAEDESDFRLHIGFGDGKAYLFPTTAGAEALQGDVSRHKPFHAMQPGVTMITGQGYKVPQSKIAGCQEVIIPPDLLARIACSCEDDPAVKGKKAVSLAVELLERGLIPLPLMASEIKQRDMQIRGRDLVITFRVSIQVKCDFWCARNGIALQTHECNPLGKH